MDWCRSKTCGRADRLLASLSLIVLSCQDSMCLAISQKNNEPALEQHHMEYSLSLDIWRPMYVQATSESLLRHLAFQTLPDLTRAPQPPDRKITILANHVLATLRTCRAPESAFFACQLITFSTCIQPGGGQSVAQVAWFFLGSGSMSLVT